MSLREFSWIIEDELAAMARPGGSARDWEQLRRRGVSALVNLTRTEWPEQALSQAGLAYLHLPIAEFRPPSPEQVEEFVRFCEEHIAGDGAVAVHCLAGRGRTGTIVACYLVHRGMDPQRAIRFVRRQRPGSIETAGQEQAVHDFARRQRENGELPGR